ncbi:alpha/beta hydrolase [Candidatus Micrarchaeota archaeon]|nr:alpha/beta hydrolase [Candidatus Micrarchaeota archaeon]
MKNCIIIHGTEGHPEENWFPWLKEQMKKYGYLVITLQFPTPEKQNPEAWLKVFKKYEQLLNRDTILIGSAGVKPIKYYEIDRPFVQDPFNWEKIRDSSEHFLVFHSEDDPLICIGNGEKIAGELGADLIRLKDAGHFNSKAGYKKFELLLEKLKPIL